ncbi:uncharacterized protein [Amphiura filiformis]|uniref:uncharacterized protein n=1 Tax=Amphiura filiformis TaxID=82378 RepID=UPI003B22284B
MSVEPTTSSIPDKIVDPEPYPSMDIHARQKKEAYDLAKLEILASGFLDSSALEANVGVLALLMGYGYRDGFFWCVVSLVIVAIILQLIIGVIMAAKYRATLGMEEQHDKALRSDAKELDPPSCWHRPKRLQFFAAIMLMILNIVNVFIIAFAGQIKGGSPDDAPPPTAATVA